MIYGWMVLREDLEAYGTNVNFTFEGSIPQDETAFIMRNTQLVVSILTTVEEVVDGFFYKSVIHPDTRVRYKAFGFDYQITDEQVAKVRETIPNLASFQDTPRWLPLYKKF